MRITTHAFRFSTLFEFLAIALLVVVSPPSARSQGPDYIINKGDQLLVTVWGYNEFTTTQTVKDNGMFTMPLIGDVKAAGLTKEEFISSLQKRLAEYIQGEIKITVSAISSVGQRVTILGAVVRPENYPISIETNLLELISMAGGYTPEARLNRIKIFHKDKTLPATEVNLEDYLDRSDIDNIPKVKPGEIVFVPRQQNVIKDFGEFFRDVAFLFTLIQLTDVGR
jgi:polysaccharide export outer membrane protein